MVTSTHKRHATTLSDNESVFKKSRCSASLDVTTSKCSSGPTQTTSTPLPVSQHAPYVCSTFVNLPLDRESTVVDCSKSATSRSTSAWQSPINALDGVNGSSGIWTCPTECEHVLPNTSSNPVRADTSDSTLFLPHSVPSDTPVLLPLNYLDTGQYGAWSGSRSAKRLRPPLPADADLAEVAECAGSYPSKRREAVFDDAATDSISSVTKDVTVQASAGQGPLLPDTASVDRLLAPTYTAEKISSDSLPSVSSVSSVLPSDKLFEPANGSLEDALVYQEPVPQMSTCSDLVLYRPVEQGVLAAAFETARATYSAAAVERLKRDLMLQSAGSERAGRPRPGEEAALVPYCPSQAAKSLLLLPDLYRHCPVIQTSVPESTSEAVDECVNEGADVLVPVVPLIRELDSTTPLSNMELD